MLTAQTTADAFALLCSCGLLALSGGVASLLAPLALLLGAAGTFPVQMLLVAMATATSADRFSPPISPTSPLDDFAAGQKLSGLMG